jgi:5-methylcytosine-specific restriction protein B
LKDDTVLAAHPYDWISELSQADDIRTFAFENWIKPARDKAETEVTIRAGDVHAAMNLSNAYPAVCNAIGGELFANFAKVKLLEKTGPNEGANVFFRFALDAGAALTIDEARIELQRRYGQPVPARGKYVTAFALPNGRELALEEQGSGVRIWMENLEGATPPSAGEFTIYEPEQGRNSNLPNRLSHNPSAALRAEGFPRSVVKVSLQTPAALAETLDWYEAKGLGVMLDRKALEILKARFLELYKDFPKLTFASNQGSYWDDERG